MSMLPRYLGPRCEECGKVIRIVYGSPNWHNKNDPVGGYCICALFPKRKEPVMKDYMGVFVEDEDVVTVNQHCTNCKFETAVDRAECNACAREWQATNMTARPGWRSKAS